MTLPVSELRAEKTSSFHFLFLGTFTSGTHLPCVRRQGHPGWGPCGEKPIGRTNLSACGGSDPPALVSLPQLTLHGTETSCCHSALPTLLFSAIKFCGGLLCSRRLLGQNVVSEIGCSSNKRLAHMTLTLGLGSRKKQKGPQRECGEGHQWRLKGKWEKSYWKMEDRGHLKESEKNLIGRWRTGGKLDSTVTWSNIEIGNVPDKFNEIATVILLPVISVQNERNQLKTNIQTV